MKWMKELAIYQKFNTYFLLSTSNARNIYAKNKNFDISTQNIEKKIQEI